VNADSSFLPDDYSNEADDLDNANANDAQDSGESDEESYLDDDSPGLWDGDRGSLDGKQRDALVMLLKRAFISSEDRVEWRTLMRDPGPITTNLNNLYFNLVIDPRSEVAFAVPARTLDNSFKTLVRDAPNNREETLLLIYLRERFRAASAAGEAHVFTDAIAMYDYVQRFRPESATDRSGDERKVTNAIVGLLVKTRDDGRYRIHRAIEALLPLTKLNLLLEAFRRINRGDAAAENFSSRDGAEEISGTSGKHALADTSASNIERTEMELAADLVSAQDDSDPDPDLEREFA
jgi:hypothetical protein